MNQNLRLHNTLKQSQFTDVGLLAARDVQAALDYERRMLWFTLKIPSKNLIGFASGKGKAGQVKQMVKNQKENATPQYQ